MQILAGAPVLARKSLTSVPAAAPQSQPEPIATAPKEEVTLSAAATKGHYSGGKVVQRALTGALTGLGAHYFTGGDVWATAKLGAAIDGTVGAVVGGLGGAVIGAAAGHPGAGALTGAGVGGGVGVLAGGTKGIVIALAGNAFGGGPLAFAGAGALLGALGL